MDAVFRSGPCSIDWCQTEVQAYVAFHSKEDLVHGDTYWSFHEEVPYGNMFYDDYGNWIDGIFKIESDYI